VQRKRLRYLGLLLTPLISSPAAAQPGRIENADVEVKTDRQPVFLTDTDRSLLATQEFTRGPLALVG
jgi:hypothetical protein